MGYEHVNAVALSNRWCMGLSDPRASACIPGEYARDSWLLKEPAAWSIESMTMCGWLC